MIKQCQSKHHCKVDNCQRRHHTLLHIEQPPPNQIDEKGDEEVRINNLIKKRQRIHIYK